MNDFNEDSGIFMTENINLNRKFDDIHKNKNRDEESPPKMVEEKLSQHRAKIKRYAEMFNIQISS
jgi:hypothetical protein